MKRISKEDCFVKCRGKDDFICNQLWNILRNQPFTEILEYENGDLYIGTTEGGKRQGYGYYLYVDVKAVYQGQWEDDTKSGYGILYNQREVIYSGEWLNNISHGFGCTYKNEELYLGCYKYGLMNGVGILRKNSSFNFCLFQSNRKKCLIKISKCMDIYLYMYKRKKVIFKEMLGNFFPFYMNREVPKVIHEEVFRILFSIDESLAKFSSNCYKEKGRIVGKFFSPPNGFLDYLNCESQITFLRGIISKADILRVDQREGKETNNTYEDGHDQCSDGDTTREGRIDQNGGRMDVRLGRYAETSSGGCRSSFHFFDNTSQRDQYKTTIPPLCSQRKCISSKSSSTKENENVKKSIFRFSQITGKKFNEKYLLYKTDSSTSSDIYMNMTQHNSSNSYGWKKKKKIKITYPLFERKKKEKRQMKKGKEKHYKLLIGEYKRKYEMELDIERNIFFKTSAKEYSKKCIISKRADSSKCRQAMVHLEMCKWREKQKQEKNVPMFVNFLSYLREINKKKKIEHIYQWKKEHVLVLLYLFKMYRYIPSFSYNNVKGFHFFIMNRQFLRDLGIYTNGHIYFLTNVINTFSNIHNTYLQTLLKWKHINKDVLLKNNAISRKELFIIKRLKRMQKMYLCYYKNAPVCLKMASYSGMGDTRGARKDEKKDEQKLDCHGEEMNATGTSTGGGETSSWKCGAAVGRKWQNGQQNGRFSQNVGTRQCKGSGDSPERSKSNIFDTAQNILFNDKLKENILISFQQIRKNMLMGSSDVKGRQIEGRNIAEDISEKDAVKMGEREQDQREARIFVEKLRCRMAFVRECFVMSNLRHPSIAKYIGIIMSQRKEKFGLVFELLRGGKSLRDCIYEENKRGDKTGIKIGGRIGKKEEFHSKWVIKLLLEIAAALRYLHDRNIYHGRLNSRNVFLTDVGHIKLCNFQNASIQTFYDYKANCKGNPGDSTTREDVRLPLPYATSVSDARSGDALTSPLLPFSANAFNRSVEKSADAYVAPEVLREEEYTDKSDIYSFGVIMYEIVFKDLPFKNECIPLFFWVSTCLSEKYVRFDVKKLFSTFYTLGDITPHVCLNILLLIKQCLNPDPRHRPNSRYLHRSLGNLLHVLKQKGSCV
ncbi:protein kinase, putative [Plasmodium ovale]|uniref:Protein kinase, putative n=1 Tax=Plasmodium ovale TaxID=36330 RepID=A0A1D3U7Y8_PLAOA|nr:protein kinase, putative [Plasmodium ovale]